MKILVPNGSSATNIGDQAILLGLFVVLKNNYSHAQIQVHATDPNSYDGVIEGNFDETLYSWAVFENRNTFVRIFRCLQLLLAYALYSRGVVTVPLQKRLRKLLDDYRLSELIVFTGGGFWRTKNGLTQTLNLGMHILMLRFAKIWGSKVVMAPVSFGPFAYSWQEKWVAKALYECVDTVLIRESISMEKLGHYPHSNAVLTSDLAFVLDAPMVNTIERSQIVIGFTLRDWLKKSKQNKFENELITVLIDAAAKYNAAILPIAQVDSLKFGDIDRSIAERVSTELKAAKVKVLPLATPRTAEEAMRVYSQIDVLLGMRMHSNILAAIVNTPFVPISYEYKTQGIAAQLGMLELCINSETDSGRDVSSVLGKVLESKLEYKRIISDNVQIIRDDLFTQFNKILTVVPDVPVNPTVTLGIAAYNAEENIGHILQSLTTQYANTFRLEKIIVHVDGGGDKTSTVVKSFTDKRVELINTHPRKGFANAFVTLMNASTSDITILFNDDVLIEDSHLIEKLILPFYEYNNVGLVCGHPAPLPGITFVDKAITTSHLAWDTMRMQIRQGHNAFTVDGKIMAMSQSFMRAIEIPKDLADMGNVDAYIYLECQRLGFGFRYVRDAIVKYRNPINMQEHFAWGIRNNANQHRYKKKYGRFVSEKYAKPSLLYASSRSQQFFKNPIGALFIFVGSFYIRRKAKVYAKSFNQTWAVIGTSKNLKS